MFRQVLIIVATTAVLILGCGKEKMWVGPTGPEPGQLTTRAAKPVVQGISFLGKKQATVNVVRVITETGQQAFGGYEYFIQFSRAISGKEITWDWIGNFGVDGRATINIVSSQDVSGYYRARLVFSHIGGQDETSTFGVIAQWASIPINSGQIINLVLPYGQQAEVITRDKIQKLTITSPLKDEVWKIGQIRRVEWGDLSIAVDRYDVTLVNAAGNHEWGITDGGYIPATSAAGFYTWVVGSLPGMFGSAEPPPPGDYYMEVSGYRSDRPGVVIATARSELFQIDPPGVEDQVIFNLVIQIRTLQKSWDDLWQNSKDNGTLGSKEVQDRLSELSSWRKAVEVQLNTILLSRLSRG